MKMPQIRKYGYATLCALGVGAFALSLLLAAPGASAKPIRRELDTGKLDTFFTSQISANNLQGMAVIIVKADGQSSGSVIYQRGFGMAGKDIPFTPQTPFPISSGSKSFLALSVMQLVEAGKVELDAPIQTYLPWWQVADPELSAQVTVRDLLNMVTGLVAGPGLYDDSGMSNRLPVDTSMEEAVRDLRSARPKLPLRTAFLYFDPNYWTLAVLVEKISGQPYPEYLQEHVLEPLGMKNTITTAERAPGMARGNLTLFGWPVAYSETITQKYLVGCCGVISTAEDLGRYLIAQLKDGQYSETRLVSPESVQLMHAPRMDVEGFMGSQYGMGWWVEQKDGITRVEAPGTWATYTSDMTLLPEQGYGIVIFYNQGCATPGLVGFPGILDGTISLLTGSEPVGGLTLRTFGLILAALALLTVGLEIFALVRLPRWAERAKSLPGWRKAVAVGVPLLEAGLLSFGFTYLVAVLTAKTFIVQTALLWWTDVLGWLYLLSILLLIKAVARFWISIQLASPAEKGAKYA
jgi:CubicO group peptidase (beta-lactamase class C family)